MMGFISDKLRKFRLKGVKVNKKRLFYGFFGLVALETGRLDSKVLKCFTETIKRELKIKRGRFWINLSDSVTVSKIPVATRMGRGKGGVVKKVAFVRKGQIICELSIMDPRDAFDILKLGAAKLPIKTKLTTY